MDRGARESGARRTHLFFRTALNERVMRPTLLMTTPRDFMEARYAILICDDDPDIRAAMKRTLRGYDVVEAGTPREAMALLRAHSFDALLSDFNLGTDDTDGLDLAPEALEAALHVDVDEWKAEIPQIQEWFEKFGDDLPAVLWTELDGLRSRLGA